MPVELAKLKTFIVSRVSVFVLIFLAVFLISAGSFTYWQAWMYLLFLVVPASFVLGYFYRHDPEFLLRRMNFNERR